MSDYSSLLAVPTLSKVEVCVVTEVLTLLAISQVRLNKTIGFSTLVIRHLVQPLQNPAWL